MDASNDVPVDIWFTQALAVRAGGSAGDAALTFLQTNATLSRGGFYFWDLVAAVAMTTPSVMTTEPLSLSIRTTGADIGRTVTDPAGTPVYITTKADANAFATVMLQAYGPRRASSPPTYTPESPAVRVIKELGARWLSAA